MAGWTGKKVNVAFSKPEEPSFLKKFKERVGYKEDHGLSDKVRLLREVLTMCIICYSSQTSEAQFAV